ncbi:MAG TPA: hypothetical protein VL405_04510 [Sphingomonas sp.]|jgi:hypothetical protein|nr:hypothetical protein [Sphingomonas sp.]
MRKTIIAAAGVLALATSPALAKGHGEGHGNGHGHGGWHGERDRDDGWRGDRGEWRGRGYAARGCPPGLRDKGCLPPGQAKKLYRIGQRWPSGYGAYNLPYSYRTRYTDNRNAYYRYSDGYIYQIDPRTQIIRQVISALLR